MKKILVLLLSFLLIQCSVPTFAQTFYNVEIGQADAVLPKVTAYMRLTDADGKQVETFAPKKEDISALLNGEPLSVSSIKEADEEETIYYYMLDVSTSVSKKMLGTVVEAIKQHIRTKTTVEKISVITFGEQITAVLDGNETEKEAFEKLDQIEPKEKATRFFDGLDKMLTLSEQDKTLSRKIAVLVSDGADLYENGATKEDVLKRLNSSNVTIYSMALPNTTKTNMEAMKNLSHETGGGIYEIPNKKGEESFQKLWEEANGFLAIEMETKTNIPMTSNGDLSLHIFWEGKEWNVNHTVRTTKWMPDETAPFVTKCESSSPTKVVVSFSENVKGADNTAHYTLSSADGEETYEILSAEYGEEDRTVTLLTDKNIYNGSYELSFKDIKDISMEENSLSESVCAFSVENSERERPLTLKTAFMRYWYYFLCLAIVLIGLVVLLILRWKSYKKKQAEAEEEKQRKLEEKEKGFLQNIQKELKNNREQTPVMVPVKPKQGKKVSFVINEYQMPQKTVDVAIGDSFIVGRSQTCDLVINDNSLSRKHCAFRYINGTLVVEDLGSTNGMSINDTRVNGIYSINDGDVIKIGKAKITVRFIKG